MKHMEEMNLICARFQFHSGYNSKDTSREGWLGFIQGARVHPLYPTMVNMPKPLHHPLACFSR